ncbi:MAG: DUF460 domain-containing protein, partial [Nanoarchaeota archaeon]
MESIIVGLDPGSIVGYAFLDLYGNLIDVGSLRGKLDDIVRKVSENGKAIIVGTDVNRVPKFIGKFSAKMNSKIISPNNDLLHIQKKRVTKEYLKFKNIKLKNKHEMDALASAIFAFKAYKKLFNKIDNEIKNEEISNKVKELVLVRQIPIKNALD